MKITGLLILTLFLAAQNSLASNRYWVGGSGVWNNSSTAHWAATSGGPGGFSVPNSTDDVFFDTNSGASVVTQSSNTYAKNFDGTGFTGTITNSVYDFLIYGDIILGSGMSVITTNDSYWVYSATGATQYFTQNGAYFNSNLIMNSVGGTLVFQDNVVLSDGGYGGYLFCQNGTLNANNQNVAIRYFATNNSYAGTRNITMGSGTWTITGAGWDLGTAPGLTLNANTSTMKFVDSTNGAKTFNGGSLTYYNVWCLNGSGGIFDVLHVLGSNVFNDFKINAGGRVAFQSGTVSIFTSFTAIGTPNRYIDILPDPASYYFSKAGGGSVCCDYLNISSCQAAPANTWFAGTHSINNPGNTGWIFSSSVTLNISSYTNVICNGDSIGTAAVNASGGVSPLSYVWLPAGDSTTMIIGLSAGTYTCIVTDFCGLATDTTSVIIAEPPAIATSQSLSICSGDSVTVGISTYTTGGTYIDILPATNGCDSTITTVLTVDTLQVSLSSFVPVCINWNPFTLTQGSPAGGTYSGSGVSSNVFDPVAADTGTHSITYTYTDTISGCSDSMTGNITVDLCTEINEIVPGDVFSIYPNPTHGKFAILLSTDCAIITVTDMLG